jgi:hypothetical protein
MRKVSAGRQRHAEEGIAGLEEGHQDGVVGLGPGMGLDVGESTLEQLFGAIDCELVNDVDVLPTSIVAPAGVTFGIFVGQDGALCYQDG